MGHYVHAACAMVEGMTSGLEYGSLLRSPEGSEPCGLLLAINPFGHKPLKPHAYARALYICLAARAT